MITPENKEILKEELYQQQLKEASILTSIDIIAFKYREIIKMLDKNKNAPYEKEELDILYNQIYKETKELENLLIGIRENHSKKSKEYEEKRRDIIISEGGVIAEAMIEDKEKLKNIPPNKRLFEETEELIKHSPQYNWMKLRRTFDYNKCQIVDSRNNKVRFEDTLEKIAEVIKEITQNQ